MGQPADARRRARRRSRRPGVHRRVHRRRGTTPSATRPARAGRQRHPRLGDEPVRRAQPDARLLLLPRVHRAELQPAAGQPREPGRGRATSDPEIGNAQAGALTGGQPSYLGRDNANQITLQDGVPGITNQYLFQPIAGAFYAPCADGGLDMSIVGHEYTHAISNRMIGGPDEGITSEQGGAMGESWGDLVGAEYMFAHGYSNGHQPVGGRSVRHRQQEEGHPRLRDQQEPAATTATTASTPPAPRSTPTARSGTACSGRSARRWSRSGTRRTPTATRTRQLQLLAGHGVARARFRPTTCPGNRRWMQLMFDAFLLQQGATSLLDARDAMLAADRMRFDGANQKVAVERLRQARHSARAPRRQPDSVNPKASFASPTADNGQITFRTPGAGKVYVGRYEARSNPVADTRQEVEARTRPPRWCRAATRCSTCRRSAASSGSP